MDSTQEHSLSIVSESNDNISTEFNANNATEFKSYDPTSSSECTENNTSIGAEYVPENVLGTPNNTVITEENDVLISPAQTIDIPIDELPLATRRDRRRKINTDVNLQGPDSTLTPKTPRRRGRPKKESP